ncbi:glycosyltransferase family 2 protein [Luethyella okanaganae]|uniref:Glycosyltransferase family 2 protein n=1 Tax=Luethyella okanaganae TaxID=69372 RepID=A0ABW1VAP7_9MICO
MSITVSVALCTHNGARFVERQVRSILAQSRPASEIVVSDDASTDGTTGIVERTVAAWRAQGRRPPLGLRVLKNESPLGVTPNFEQALAACEGTLIALCDQDDEWHPDKLARMVAEFEARPSLELLHSDARIVDAAGTPSGATLLDTLAVSVEQKSAIHGGRALDVLLRRNVCTGATMLVHARLVEQARPFPASWVHDEWLAVVAAATGEMDLLEQSLIDYRQHGGNQIGATILNGSGRLARLRTPRTERNARLLDRAADLAERMPRLSAVSAETIARSVEKLRHERVRSSLPKARILRVGPVLREWLSGRYREYGLGGQDVLRDLVQPV